jgi:hypothetical protein
MQYLSNLSDGGSSSLSRPSSPDDGDPEPFDAPFTPCPTPMVELRCEARMSGSEPMEEIEGERAPPSRVGRYASACPCCLQQHRVRRIRRLLPPVDSEERGRAEDARAVQSGGWPLPKNDPARLAEVSAGDGFAARWTFEVVETVGAHGRGFPAGWTPEPSVSAWNPPRPRPESA